MNDVTPTPHFLHDCPHCVHVASVAHSGKRRLEDWYICPNDQYSVIIRFGSDGSDYGSFPMFIARDIDDYREAIKMAAYVIERFDHIEGARAKIVNALIDHVWSLEEYLTWFKHMGWGLTQDLDHWAGYGITTARGLADYLDLACVQNAR